MNRRRSQNQNFDSLLDTMANVVGILVVVMAFTQIHVGEAVRRIQQEVEASAGRDASDDPHTGAIRESDRLQKAIASFALESGDAPENMDELRGQLTRLEDAISSGKQGTLTTEEVAKALVHEDRIAVQLETTLAALKAEEHQLQIRLNGARGDYENAVHRIRLPDPRPAPLGTKEMTFFCRYGRVNQVDIKDLDRRRNTALGVAETASRHSGRSSVSNIVRHFRTRDIGDKDYRWRMEEISHGGVYVQLEFRNEEIGENRSAIASIESEYRRGLAKSDPNRRFILFHVWPDSFSVYLRARSIAEEMGYSVGWKTLDFDEEYDGYLSHGPADPTNPIPVD
jgi:hypothetical protein